MKKMWRMEDVIRELKEEGILEDGIIGKCEKRGGLPPGFRFHPTDEELITFYLASKVFNTTITTSVPNNLFLSDYYSGVQIVEVDLTRCEPWDLPGACSFTFFTKFLLIISPLEAYSFSKHNFD